MQDWQVGIFIQAQAAMVEVEGMKVQNEERHVLGFSPAYDEQSFLEKAAELMQLSQDIRP